MFSDNLTDRILVCFFRCIFLLSLVFSTIFVFIFYFLRTLMIYIYIRAFFFSECNNITLEFYYYYYYIIDDIIRLNYFTK